MNALRESCTAIQLFTIVLNTILLSRRAIFAALLWEGGSLHSVNHDWIYY